MAYLRHSQTFGPWRVTAYGYDRNHYWWIVNQTTGGHKRVGRVGGPRGDGRGTNYFDVAVDLANKRNLAWQAEHGIYGRQQWYRNDRGQVKFWQDFD